MRNRVWTILAREYRERVRRRSFILSTVLTPLFIIGVTVIPLWLASRTSTKPVRLIVVDHTAVLSKGLEEAFPDTLANGLRRYSFDRTATPDSIAADFLAQGMREQILEGAYTGLLWIPPDAISGAAAELYVPGFGGAEATTHIDDALTRAAMVHRLGERGIAEEETGAISRRVQLKTYKLSDKGVDERGLEEGLLSTIAFALVLYMTIMLHGISVQRSILEDKNSRIVEILLSTARPFQLMLGKIVGVGAVGLTQYLIWAAVVVAAKGYVQQSKPTLGDVTSVTLVSLTFFVTYFVLGYLLFASIYAAVGAIVNTDQEAQQMQWPITSLLVIPMLLMQIVLRDPNSTASVILSLVPFFTPILMMMRINMATPPAWQLLLSILLQVGMILLMAAFAARIFRIGILMYGKRPTLPELLRWVRAS